MDVKLTLLVLVTLALLVNNTSADFYYNRPMPSADALIKMDLKCFPGRTIMKVEEKQMSTNVAESKSDEYSRRNVKYMTSNDDETGDERCSMCVCSADGTEEYCNKRPVGSVNECMRMKTIMSKYTKGEPYEHWRSYPFRARKDLIWHNDEIPYDPTAKCYRGHTYYTNHDTPNDTNINYDHDITSLLDFKSQTACFYCICSVSGYAASCISRNLWFCNYLRYLRSDKAPRDMYANLFQQDRPAYFRQLSWRLRRTMDNSMFDFIEEGGDTLCCSHPDGHRRQIHNEVHNKLRTLKRRIPKENLMGGSMRGDYVDFIVNND